MLRSLVTFLSLGGVAGALTWLFLGMRAVMAVGGSCGSGGPYVVAQECPSGSTTAILGGIFGGMVCLAVYTIAGLRFGPRLTLLAWPALFLSLGYNFLESGLEGSGSGWICAILFFVMGGAPLLFLVNGSALRRTFASPVTTGPAVDVGRWLPARQGIVATGSDTGQPDDLSHALERLATLHSSGALTDDEFTAATRRLLDGDRNHGVEGR